MTILKKAAREERRRNGTALSAMDEIMMGRGRYLRDQVEKELRWCGAKLVALPSPIRSAGMGAGAGTVPVAGGGGAPAAGAAARRPASAAGVSRHP